MRLVVLPCSLSRRLDCFSWRRCRGSVLQHRTRRVHACVVHGGAPAGVRVQTGMPLTDAAEEVLLITRTLIHS